MRDGADPAAAAAPPTVARGSTAVIYICRETALVVPRPQSTGPHTVHYRVRRMRRRTYPGWVMHGMAGEEWHSRRMPHPPEAGRGRARQCEDRGLRRWSSLLHRRLDCPRQHVTMGWLFAERQRRGGRGQRRWNRLSPRRRDSACAAPHVAQVRSRCGSSDS